MRKSSSFLPILKTVTPSKDFSILSLSSSINPFTLYFELLYNALLTKIPVLPAP